MSVLDVFNSSIFDMSSMTAAVDKLPRVPGRISKMKLFADKPINTMTAIVEERHGKLELLNTAQRGTVGQTSSRPSRFARSFVVPHIPHNDQVTAEEVQGVRAFGSETQLETVASVVNEKLQAMKNNHEITWEYHQAGALQGEVLDADGSTIYDWFTEFGITEVTVDFDLSVAATDQKAKCNSVIRTIRNALGGTPYTGIHALCGNTFFDEFVSHPLVKAAFERWQDGQFLREGQIEAPFKFAGITFENYDYTVDSKLYIPATHARFFPTGTQGIFVRANAPANFVETVNTMGRPLYAKQELQRFATGVDLHSQSNPLFICTRPRVLVLGTNT